MDEEIVFTPSTLFDFLQSIDELSDKEIGLDVNGSSIRVTIGESVYDIDTSNATEVEVDEEVVDTVEEIADSSLEEISEQEDIDTLEDVESGLLKEAVKSLLLGGMIRLSKKLLQ